MDSVQRHYYGLHFRVAFREKAEAEFEDWFVKLAGYAFGADFQPVRAYGNEGDWKCDGYRSSTRTVFQCYAPRQMRVGPLVRKIERDFNGARAHWEGMAKWVFVHNDPEGLPSQAHTCMDRLRQSHPDICFEFWSETQLRELTFALTAEAAEAIFGQVPSQLDTDSVVMEDLKPVIESLQRSEPPPSNRQLKAPSVAKLEKNSLSEDATQLLKQGRRKEALVANYFDQNPPPDLDERIAEAFRNRYRTLKEEGLSPDSIFWALQKHAGMQGEPKRQGAALAVLSYFFERCDIFEDAGAEK